MFIHRSALFSSLLLIPALLAASSGHANVGDAYGFGSRAAAMAGAGVATGFSAYSSYYNPAMLPFAGQGFGSSDPERRLTFNYGVIYMEPSFKPIENVVIENQYSSDPVVDGVRVPTLPGNVDTKYRSTFGQAIGLSYAISNGSVRPTLGVTAFLPIEAVSYIDTGEIFIPEYILYRARTQRPQFDAAIGFRLTPYLSLGGGFHVGYGLTTSASGFILSGDDKSSRMRIAASLKPRAGPFFGAFIQPTEQLSFGAVFRAAVSSPNEMTVKTGARVINVVPGIDMNFSALSAIYYDPMTVELGGALLLPIPALPTRVTAQVDYQAWGKFEAPFLRMDSPKADSCTDEDDNSCAGLPLAPTRSPSYPYRNIWVPRAGAELEINRATVRFGYSYRPSIFDSLPTGAGNALDPSKHIVTAGLGYRFDRFLHFDTPATIDLHFAYHALKTQTITKSEGDEAGNGTGDLKIGAPGYQAGGRVLGGGLSLSLEM